MAGKLKPLVVERQISPGTLQKFFYRNGYQYLERLRRTGPQSFEVLGHTAEPHAGPYIHELTLPEKLRWMNGPEEVTRIE